jgi:error-prone DNA polymerase
MYVPLFVKSCFSFLEGASHPEELVEHAHFLGLPALAITDRDGLYGIVRAHTCAREHGIKLIAGAQMTLEDTTSVTLLAMSHAGYSHLCRLITKGRLRSPKGVCTVTYAEVCEHAEGLIALWGGDQSLLVKDLTAQAPREELGKSAIEMERAASDRVKRDSVTEPRDTQRRARISHPETEADAGAIGDALREAFGDRLYAALTRHRRASEPRAEMRLRERARRLRIPLVACNEALYHTAARRDLQDVLTCIRHRSDVTQIGARTRPNAEHDLKTPHAFELLFGDAPDAVARTREIAERCTFSLAEIRYRYPAEKLPDGKTSSAWLEELTFRGARWRFGDDIPARFREQIQKELALIEQLDYGGYFLTMWEIVELCRKEGILCQGRGSAANSIVCYALGITAVDPGRIDLLFERFLSKERAEPPDIDLDIMHERREEVIQHVYKKYGRDRAAMVANVITYRARSALRDVGKALGLPPTAIDRIAKLVYHYDGLDPELLRHADLDPRSPTYRHLLRLAREIQGFPRHLSIHPGGFLLGHLPVHDLVPIENAVMEDRTVIQWDKDDLESLGLFKVDLLGLGALTQLERAFRLIALHHGKSYSLATIPSDDRATFDAITRADTVGVFQIESRAQMAMLPRLAPRTFYDLVIEISIVRPGPITGGMVHPYLRRRAGKEPVTLPHPSLALVLKKTLGVPLFQEQVMQIAVIVGDYTPGEADQLRRDMAAWRKTGRLERHRERLMGRMIHNGVTPELAERIFDQIKGFGEYGFPESHAASFALIAYATAYLKTHYSEAFTCATLNAQPMGFYTPATLVLDAKRHAIEVRPICIEASDWDCTLERVSDGRTKETCRARGTRGAPPHAIRMGLRYVKGLSETRDWPRIQAARAKRPFDSLDDLVTRTELDDRTLAKLATTGALDILTQVAPDETRRTALWDLHALTPRRNDTLRIPTHEPRPKLRPLSALEHIAWDYRHSHHSARGHPLEPLRDALAAQDLPDARTVQALPHGEKVRYAGLVIGRQRPGTASGVTFITLEDETGFVNLVVWKQIFERYIVLVKTASFLGVTGDVQKEDGVVHIVANRFWEPRVRSSVERIRSRDFK